MFFYPDCVSWDPISWEHDYYDEILSFIPEDENSDSVGDMEYESEDSVARKDKFVQIFDNNWWMSKVSRSGEGSELTNTVRVQQVLDKVVERLKKDLGKDVIT